MAARRSIESCLVCAPEPCMCSKTASKPKVNSKKLTAPGVPATQESVQQPAEQFDPTTFASVQPSRRTAISSIARSQPSPEDLQERIALTILCRSGLIHHASIEEVRDKLNMTVSEIDVLIWRQRRLAWLPPKI